MGMAAVPFPPRSPGPPAPPCTAGQCVHRLCSAGEVGLGAEERWSHGLVGSPGVCVMEPQVGCCPASWCRTVGSTMRSWDTAAVCGVSCHCLSSGTTPSVAVATSAGPSGQQLPHAVTLVVTEQTHRLCRFIPSSLAKTEVSPWGALASAGVGRTLVFLRHARPWVKA